MFEFVLVVVSVARRSFVAAREMDVFDANPDWMVVVEWMAVPKWIRTVSSTSLSSMVMIGLRCTKLQLNYCIDYACIAVVNHFVKEEKGEQRICTTFLIIENEQRYRTTRPGCRSHSSTRICRRKMFSGFLWIGPTLCHSRSYSTFLNPVAMLKSKITIPFLWVLGTARIFSKITIMNPMLNTNCLSKYSNVTNNYYVFSFSIQFYFLYPTPILFIHPGFRMFDFEPYLIATVYFRIFLCILTRNNNF